MSSKEKQEFEINVDLSEAEADLAQMEMHVAQVERSVLQTTRKAYNSLGLLLDIVGITIPTTIQLFAGAAFLAGEMLLELGAAETITGVLAVKALFTFSMAAVLFSRVVFMQGEASKAQSTLNNLILLHAQWF